MNSVIFSCCWANPSNISTSFKSQEEDHNDILSHRKTSKTSPATFKVYVSSQEGGITIISSYTCAMRFKVLFVQTVGQFKAYCRTCFSIKPSLVFTNSPVNIIISDHLIYGERHCWSLARQFHWSMPHRTKPFQCTISLRFTKCPWSTPSSVRTSLNSAGDRLLALECRAESTGVGRRLLGHMQNDSSFKFNHEGWRSISERWPLLLNQQSQR